MQGKNRLFTICVALFLVLLQMFATWSNWVVIPLEVVVFIFLAWSFDTEHTERILSQIPGGKMVIPVFYKVENFLNRPDKAAGERLQIARRIVPTLTTNQIALLRALLISGRPFSYDDRDWQALERTGLVDRDFTGPKGVKDEFKDILPKVLDEDQERRRKESLDQLSEHLQYGIRQLFNRSVRSVDDLTAFKADLNKWHHTVCVEIEQNFWKPKRTYFEDIGSMTAAHFTQAFDAEHNRYLSHMEIYIERLRDITMGR